MIEVVPHLVLLGCIVVLFWEVTDLRRLSRESKTQSQQLQAALAAQHVWVREIQNAAFKEKQP